MNNMKRLSIILNVILFILVGVLFYLHFSEKGIAKNDSPINRTGDSVQYTNFPIAYVNIDSLEAHYAYFQEKKSELEKKQQTIQNELSNLAKDIQNDIAELRKNAPTMTQSEGEAAQRSIIKKQQDLQQKEQNLRQQFLKEQQQFNEELHNRLNDFLKKYNAGKKYAYILSYSEALSDILYKDTAYNITADVIRGLNEAEDQNEGNGQ
jgi:outer membrane protein